LHPTKAKVAEVAGAQSLHRKVATKAKVAELVDAHDSKSCIFGCAGSIPAFGTRPSENQEVFDFPVIPMRVLLLKQNIHRTIIPHPQQLRSVAFIYADLQQPKAVK
jgi:hypothetical protein